MLLRSAQGRARPLLTHAGQPQRPVAPCLGNATRTRHAGPLNPAVRSPWVLSPGACRAGALPPVSGAEGMQGPAQHLGGGRRSSVERAFETASPAHSGPGHPAEEGGGLGPGGAAAASLGGMGGGAAAGGPGSPSPNSGGGGGMGPSEAHAGPRIFVGKLPKGTVEDDVKQYFMQCAPSWWT